MMSEMLATYKKAEDLINIGAYKSGSNPKIDQSIAMKASIEYYLKQDTADASTFQESLEALSLLFADQDEQALVKG